MTQPIFERVMHDLGHAVHSAEDDITSLFHHTSPTSTYTATSASTTAQKGPEMGFSLGQLKTDLETAVKGVVDDTTNAYDKAQTMLEQHLPQVAQLADAAANNPAVEAVLNAVHVPADVLTGFADSITKLEAVFAAQPAPTAPAPAAPAPAAPAAATVPAPAAPTAAS